MAPVKSRTREREIAKVLAHNVFEWLWTKWKIGGILGAIDKPHIGKAPQVLSQPEQLRLTLEELGTTFIKIGQMLSTRPDLLPPDYIAELTKLQDNAPRVPYEAIALAIKNEFGCDPQEVFQTFEVESRAAGSIAQVHNATLPDGTSVVVKVRRPGIEKLVEEDLAILGQMVRFLSHHTELGKKYELESILDEFAYSLRNELDFAREGQNAERIAAQFADDPRLHIPTIYWDFSAPTVLTMENVQGIKIDDLDALDKAGMDRHELAENCAHIALVQILDFGFFHADPHPGNFFVLPTGVIGLIDYGMVGRLGDKLREALLRIALAVSRHDSERLSWELLALGVTKEKVDQAALSRDLDRLMAEYEGGAIGSISAAKIFQEISALVQKYEITLPSDLVMVARVIAMDEGMGAFLDPDFKLLEFAKPYFERFWRKSHSLPEIGRRLKEDVVDFADFAQELPKRLQRLTTMAEHGELTVISRVDMPDQIVKKFQHTANRIAISVLMAGLIVGLSVLAQVYRTPETTGVVSIVVRGLLVIAILTGAYLVHSFWKSER